MIKIAVDAMGGEGSPLKVIDGVIDHNKKNTKCYYQLFGEKTILTRALNNRLNKKYYEIINCNEKVEDSDSPLSAAKKKETSMFQAINSVKLKKSDIIISAGNTGALFIIAKINLDMIKNIDKPALSALWPNKKGMSVVLDLGANIECSEKNLIDFSIMGSSLLKSLYEHEEPKVAILNIGSEEYKGNEVIKKTYQTLISSNHNNFDFKGYIEGNHIMNGDVNVIVTDGFTGNVALKTAEGTANFITNEMKNSFKNSFLGKISALINYKNLKKFKDKLDPRLYNGAILLGLDSPVIKSHGSTDYLGFSNSLDVCYKIVKGNLIEKIKNNIN